LQNRSLPRAISLIENDGPGYLELLRTLSPRNVPVIGITGPPGAGKSTLTDALIAHWVGQGKKIGVLCIDPSSPFHKGALLGDRIRMSNWYLHPQVFIRSLASRGSLGGLHPKIIEITELMKSADFDLIITETVGVGQSEVAISGLADITLLLLVPEAGDDVQTLKSGIMEIADIFVLNKSDRPESDTFLRHLRALAALGFSKQAARSKSALKDDSQEMQSIPVVKTVATLQQGITELVTTIEQELSNIASSPRRYWQMAERAFQLIQKERMKEVSKTELAKLLEDGMGLMEVVATYQNL